IVAITFTRKASQEMAARLREWLYFLATAPDDEAREFLRQREIAEAALDAALARSRLLYERFLTAQPPITITTFHSWFLQLLKRAPLEAGALGDVNLAEQTGALVDEAWERFGSRVQRDPDGDLARALDNLFREYGLDSTRRLLRNFLMRRGEWWAYTHGQSEPVAWSLARIAAEMGFDPQTDVLAQLATDEALRLRLAEFVNLLERNTQSDVNLAQAYIAVEDADDLQAWFAAAKAMVLTKDGGLRARKPSGAQSKRLGPANEARMLELHAALGERILSVCAQLTDQACYRANASALECGAALLEAYQAVKAERQMIDYADIEWHAYRLVSVSDHAVYMHYKLDSRYRHILLDEFQDTNPLQWLTLRSWFEAGAEADSRPTVFLVGDPKQSIYRFRRAEARLFTHAATYLRDVFGAPKVLQQQSRRCAPAVIEVVNQLFSVEPEFLGYEVHTAHAVKAGRVEVMPLVKAESTPGSDPNFLATAKLGSDPKKMGSDPGFSGSDPGLRNPLEHPFEVQLDLRREDEAKQLVAGIERIVGRWQVADGESSRAASYRDIMILVKRRTHLAVYEQQLRGAGIPFITSRHGGLLATLEAQDMVALLEFIVSPFADLRLAHVLRSPVFACSDEDLIALAREAGNSWWERLEALAQRGEASAALKRAHALLSRWLAQSDGLPVHDQLDRIYFEGGVMRRYAAAVPPAMRDSVLANLHAFMQRALDTDAGRYPSLPRFLHDLIDLADAPTDEAPDEGIVGDAGDAVRIYTVHGAKGLEAPIVWLLDAGAGQEPGNAYDVVVDWPPEAAAPSHFSVCTRKAEQSVCQQRIADAESVLDRREELNLLYVAMTRAEQALIVSGSDGTGLEESWYEKVRAAVRAAQGLSVVGDDTAQPAVYGDALDRGTPPASAAPAPDARVSTPVDPRLRDALPTGERRPALSSRGQHYGTQFHRLMERLTAGADTQDRAAIQKALALGDREFAPMWDSARRLMSDATLTRFFEPGTYTRAANELAYVTAAGEVRRIDRLVEFPDEVWVLDYKTGAPPDDAVLTAAYDEQMQAYGAAVATMVPGKAVKGLLLFSGGEHRVIQLSALKPPPP
ncbi:MAG: UvrD/REP helicase, partial [Betaproteobacteria bacterium]|nr:UvrD/REP helicase [Betaproteobacteria bacterium]